MQIEITYLTCRLKVLSVSSSTVSMLKNRNSLNPESLSSTRRASIYHWRWYKKKGVTLVLLWSFVAFSITSLSLHFFFESSTYIDLKKDSFIVVVFATIFLPLAGWLADVYIGRYRVIKICVFLMWIGCFLYTFGLVLKEVHSGVPERVLNTGGIIVTVFVCVALGGFQANIVQFGMDQLFDSSSDEIMSYTVFYIWSFVASDVMVRFASCVCIKSTAVFSLLFVFLLTLTICSDILFNQWLIKEPVTHNPLKLIFKVLRYAMKHKYPRQRSAFTYWDDKRFSRLDLAKSKYGGPFTIEQVEDVKTFFRILVIIVLGCLFVGLMMNSVRIAYVGFVFRVKGVQPSVICFGENVTVNYSTCLKDIVIHSGTAAVFIFVPLWEFILFPLFWKCCRRLGLFVKLVAGVILSMVCLIVLTSMELTGQFTKHNTSNNTCTLSSSTAVTSDDYFDISYGWLVLPNIIYSFGVCIMCATGLQFISAQAPYSMKGLLLGLFYFWMGISIMAFYFFPELFTNKFSFFYHGLGNLSCAFWCLLGSIIVILVLVIVLFIALYCYKNRLRDDNLPSQHFFAENYYDQQLRSEGRNCLITTSLSQYT